MSVWGTIIGGAAGFALGGPLGAIMGALAGHAVDKIREIDVLEPEPLKPTQDGTRKIAFTIGVIVLGAKMAKVDGAVTQDEIRAFREVFRVPPDEIKNVARIFNLAKKDARGFEPYARQISNLFEPGSPVLEELLASLFHIAKSDGRLKGPELDYLKEVARIFGFDEMAFERIRAQHTGEESADPYTVLGITPETSDEDVKKTYRDLMRENHPDRLMAQGMPPEFIEIANEKVAAINAAYDRIRKHRGMK
ncbi:MAG: TerB family tellurite resistance protein [Alphaproteobacteria bacterium]|nr:TerB family tellurite resistance protein [Alphaproteobacteria bacterium]MBU0795691.1 TerB family tellurite resistance protein [Alphaproteobacteria bacterium]MBU0887314.1 TerB family tellurite resistance protein [Alphaproteobacteria bacterium]MBU1811805.1 TerB family tellurite resistance protein [Alphaproteobacteria bacterium]MBU2089900.1 TerB family tellurite resistance protein [Alphaproteobacteria bacterium]